MTDRKRQIEKAIREQKAYYGCCPFTESIMTDGAHIIPRDVRPDLVAERANILPMRRNVHRELDKLADRDFQARLDFCIDNSLPEYKGKVRQQIEELKERL